MNRNRLIKVSAIGIVIGLIMIGYSLVYPSPSPIINIIGYILTFVSTCAFGLFRLPEGSTPLPPIESRNQTDLPKPIVILCTTPTHSVESSRSSINTVEQQDEKEAGKNVLMDPTNKPIFPTDAGVPKLWKQSYSIKASKLGIIIGLIMIGYSLVYPSSSLIINIIGYILTFVSTCAFGLFRLPNSQDPPDPLKPPTEARRNVPLPDPLFPIRSGVL